MQKINEFEILSNKCDKKTKINEELTVKSKLIKTDNMNMRSEINDLKQTILDKEKTIIELNKKIIQ